MLPLVLLTGFLGAGKTTLLQNLLQQARSAGQRVAVVVNEFGAVDIDGALLRSQEVEALAAVAGGCACCSGQEEFVSLLAELAAKPDRPDVFVVEASGLADPLLLLELVAGPELKNHVVTSAVLTVIDAAGWNHAVTVSRALVLRQIGLADWLIINKADLVTTEALDGVDKKIHELNTNARVISAVHGDADFTKILFAQRQRVPEQSNLSGEPSNHIAHTYFCPMPHPVDATAVQTAMEALGAEVWRAKGFLRFRGQSGLWLLQFTAEDGPASCVIAPVHLPLGMEEPELGLVFIGSKLDIPALTSSFGSHKLLAFF